MRILALLIIMLAVSGLLMSCGGGQQETTVERAEEEGSTGEATLEERDQTQEATLEETNGRAETTVEERTAPAEVAISEAAPEPAAENAVTKEAVNLQEEERMNAPPEKAAGEQDQAQEDVSATQAVTPDPATVGSPLTFTITVTNNSSPQHVGFKDFLPPDVTFVSATPGQGFCGPPHHGANVFDCTLGVIPTGGSVTVEVVAIPTVPGTVTNLAQAGGGFAPVSSVPATVTVNPG